MIPALGRKGRSQFCMLPSISHRPASFGLARRRFAPTRVWSLIRCASTAIQPPSKVIFSGIQPTGVPHIGNYLGALREWVKLQESSAPDTKLLYSLVDLHAITIQQNQSQLHRWKHESLAMLLAIGLDPKRSIIFHQSDVPAHSELMWILSCQASTGYLSRMTQWKDKTANEKDNNPKAKLGLFSYPVLMAADVLVHQTTHVPVGHDQAQHLEFTRELASGFNHIVGESVLHPPETLISPAKRIMNLIDASMKMSKSATNPKSRILLTDSFDEIHSKIKSTRTDDIGGISYDPERRPGISNLIDIMFHTADGKYPDRESLVRDFAGVSKKKLKAAIADTLEATLLPIRERYAEIVQNHALLKDVAFNGAQQANNNAQNTMTKVKRAVGLSS
nr:tryptophan--trna ligase, mitochondrial [Quercus suber]